MTELVSTTPGLYPLPDRAKSDLSDLKGHQKHDLISGDEGAEIREVYADVRSELIADQLEAGLDLIVEGQARWDDMLAHPLTVHQNVETRGIVRYYDNNNFYREPVVQGALEESGDVAAELVSASEILAEEGVDAGERLQAVLPGPYTLSELATDEHYGDDAEFLSAIAEFLADEVAAFPDHAALFLLEPSLVSKPPAKGELASEAIDAVARATDANVVVHTYWGALEEKTHAHLLDASIDAVGYDFVTEPEANADLLAEYGTADSIALGLLDGQNTLVEEPEAIHRRVEWVLDRLPGLDFETIYATPNTELFYLPVNRYREKLGAVGEAVSLREVSA